MDKRTNRVQPIRLSPDFFPLDIHKSVFINELQITIPAYYAKSWGDRVLSVHDKTNFHWEVEIDYEGPKDLNRIKQKFKAVLYLSFIKKRSQQSSYRLKWDKDFAVQLASDYPKSFVRSLEFHIGDEIYKEKKFTEYDIGGFKEQIQVKIDWQKGHPRVKIKEFFRVKEESQDFPYVYKELSSYLIADYLLSDEQEVLRRIQTTKWKKRNEIHKELNENNIYLLLNRELGEIYIGETEKSLSKRYPESEVHHTFNAWDEYTVIQLPQGTNKNTRKLIERVLIRFATKVFPSELIDEPSVLSNSQGLKLKNKRL